MSRIPTKQEFEATKSEDAISNAPIQKEYETQQLKIYQEGLEREAKRHRAAEKASDKRFQVEKKYKVYKKKELTAVFKARFPDIKPGAMGQMMEKLVNEDEEEEEDSQPSPKYVTTKKPIASLSAQELKEKCAQLLPELDLTAHKTKMKMKAKLQEAGHT